MKRPFALNDSRKRQFAFSASMQRQCAGCVNAEVICILLKMDVSTTLVLPMCYCAECTADPGNLRPAGRMGPAKGFP